MKRELTIITCCENKLIYSWQVRVQCHNFREHGISDKLQVLVFVNKDDKAIEQWYGIQRDYPEVGIFFYIDNEDVRNRIIIPTGYNPLIRPYLLANHFALYPELSNKAIWYIDTDIILTKKIDFDRYLSDDIVYMSDCRWYLGSKYFDSKEKDVKPELLEEYKKIDVLNEAANLVGINRKICEDNFEGSGGAQSLLKNVDSKFFVEVFNNCIALWNYFHFNKGGINKKYFKDEATGFQTWAIADMNGLLWNLWKHGIKTECIADFDFTWNTSPISDIDKVSIYHDAGYTDSNSNSFNKYNFCDKEPFGINPDIYNHDLASFWYVGRIISAKPV